MAIAYVNSDNGVDNSGGAITSLATAGVLATAGNLLVVSIAWGAGAQTVTGITDSAGNDGNYAPTGALFVDGTSNARIQQWYVANCAGHAANVVTVAWSGNVAFATVTVEQYSGIATASDPLDVTATGTCAGSITSDPFTTTQADEVIVSATYKADLGGSWTAGSGYTLREDLSTTGVQDQIVSAIQTGATATITNTHTVGVLYTMYLSTFKAPSSGGGNPWYAYAQQ